MGAPKQAKIISDMIRNTETMAAKQPDMVALAITAIRSALAKNADPYLLAGALIEAVAVTIAEKVPPERQGPVAVEAVRLLRDRLREWGVV